MYSYYNDFARLGNLATVSTPWQDAPATVGAVTTSPSNCRVVTYHNYAPQVYTSYQSATPVTSAFETASARARRRRFLEQPPGKPPFHRVFGTTVVTIPILTGTNP